MPNTISDKLIMQVLLSIIKSDAAFKVKRSYFTNECWIMIEGKEYKITVDKLFDDFLILLNDIKNTKVQITKVANFIVENNLINEFNICKQYYSHDKDIGKLNSLIVMHKACL